MHESTPQPTSYSDAEGQVPVLVPQTIVRLPTDILYRIFTLLLPTSYQPPVDGEYDSALKFFACTAPYNIARVCRSWRAIVLSSPSLWSSFFFRLSSPSYRTLKLMKTSIEYHLMRSGNLPLTCFVRLDGRYSKSLSQNIATILSAHQSRWRRVEIRFDLELDFPYNDDEDDALPTPNVLEQHSIPPPLKINLFIKELGLLEDLRLIVDSTYDLIRSSESMRDSEASSLSSLQRLDLVDHGGMVVNWLSLAPNIKELNLSFSLDDVEQAHESSVSSKFLIPENIQILRIRRSYYRLGDLAATGFLFCNLTCPVLTELQLLMVHNSMDLYNFVRRSMPPLRVLNLELILDSDTTLRPEQIIHALALIPTISELKLEVLCHNDFQLTMSNALIRTRSPSDLNAPFSLLPALETLELGSFRVGVIELIAARWRCFPPWKTLKSVTLSGYGAEDQASLAGFKPGDDLACLPVRWNLLKECITEGLRFSITK